jgi:glycosyltransferase involved in cell wall biosynthesis
MKNEIIDDYSQNQSVNELHFGSTNGYRLPTDEKKTPTILFITSYPPRECGIATYSQDLIQALNSKFGISFSIKVCALESDFQQHTYGVELHSTFDTSCPARYAEVATSINQNNNIKIVLIQHEFGFFNNHEQDFESFLYAVTKPIILVFHTVLPNPTPDLKQKVRGICCACESVIVMTNNSARVLVEDYGLAYEKITVIPHGTHLVPHLDKDLLKAKYGVENRKILSTFGLLSSGKGIETTLGALPEIIKTNPDILFLIIGKTHPTIVKHEGEHYRKMLETKISELQLQGHVQFINHYLVLTDLLEYLQLTDIYLFTSKDPNQAVSGTFSYAISCGCPVISTPIPHAREILSDDIGIIIDFENSQQLSQAVIRLLEDEPLRKNISSNGLHRMASTAWENSAIAHATLFEKITAMEISLQYTLPAINLSHIKKMTTDFGMIQFSILNQPDMDSGYTLDDNARAMVTVCQHYELTNDESDLHYITIYLKFISHCLQSEGYFLNYVNEQQFFTEQNTTCNLADANGRAIWALGYLISMSSLLPEELTAKAEDLLHCALLNIHSIYSTRAMAFAIKGLYYCNTKNYSVQNLILIKELANRLVQMYRHESDKKWQWFEGYLTYGNSILPEAMLCAWLATGNLVYKEIAKSTFDFLLSKTFTDDRITIISNRNWLHRESELDSSIIGGEQPIDVAYTIIALKKFYHVFKDEEYKRKMQISFILKRNYFAILSFKLHNFVL